jgi:hypothetical protein
MPPVVAARPLLHTQSCHPKKSAWAGPEGFGFAFNVAPGFSPAAVSSSLRVPTPNAVIPSAEARGICFSPRAGAPPSCPACAACLAFPQSRRELAKGRTQRRVRARLWRVHRSAFTERGKHFPYFPARFEQLAHQFHSNDRMVSCIGN